MGLYKAYNGAVPTTLKQAAVSTGTALKTMIQLTAGAQDRITIVAWGADFFGAAAGVPGALELVATGTVPGGVASTVTPIIMRDGDGASSSGCAVLPSSEGTITTTRMYESRGVAPTGQYSWEFSLGREPIVPVSNVVRVRTHFPVAVDCVCWIMWED